MRGALEGTLGKALLPISARMLFEDGARWNWFPHSATTATAGESLKALVNDGARRRDRIASSLQSDGAPRPIIDELLGPAVNIPQFDPGERAFSSLTALHPESNTSDSRTDHTT